MSVNSKNFLLVILYAIALATNFMAICKIISQKNFPIYVYLKKTGKNVREWKKQNKTIQRYEIGLIYSFIELKKNIFLKVQKWKKSY